MGNYIMDLRKLVGHRTLIQCAASIIIVDEKGRLLLGRRTDNHLWGYSGGSIELDERAEDCAKRELFEEMGLIADELEFFMVNSGPEVHYIYPNGDEVSNIELIYICRKYHGNISMQKEELEDIRFFAPEDIRIDMISPPIRPVFLKYLKEKCDISIRCMSRDDWHCINERAQLMEDYSFMGFEGKISILKMLRVDEPFRVTELGKNKVIAAKGYSWVQLAFADQAFWLTAMFDEKNEFIEIYVDITAGNVVDTDLPFFRDMYLDYVVFRDELLELDKSELQEAFESGKITAKEYENARSAGESFKRFISENKDELINELCKQQSRLLGKLNL